MVRQNGGRALPDHALSGLALPTAHELPARPLSNSAPPRSCPRQAGPLNLGSALEPPAHPPLRAWPRHSPRPSTPQPRPSAPPTGRHVSPPATPPLDPGPAPNCPSRGPRPAPDDAPKPASLWLRPSPNSPGLMLPLLPRQGGGAPAMLGKEEPGLCSGETPTPGKLSPSTKGEPRREIQEEGTEGWLGGSRPWHCYWVSR